jgi:Family of unknown function (DUF6279)
MAIVLVSVAFAGCATKLLYNHADWLIARQLDGYFDLSRPQKTFVHARLDSILDHHRHEALPRYEAVLQEAGTRFQQGLTIHDLDWAFAQYDQLKRELFARFVPDGTEFVRLVKEPQVEQLRKSLQQRLARDEELLREDVQTRLAKRTERIVALAKDWLGPLSEGQEQEIVRLAMAFPDTLPARYAYQDQRNKQLIEILEARHEQRTADRLYEWLVEQEKYADPQFLEAVKQFRERVTELVIAIDHLATTEQRRHVLSKLDDLTKTIHGLSRT